MRIDGQVVDKNLPDWANGQLATIGDKQLLLLREKPRLRWPRWWHRFGMLIGWRRLATWQPRKADRL